MKCIVSIPLVEKNKEYIQTMMEFQWLSSCGAEIQCPVVNFGIAAVALSERLLH